MIVRTLVGLLLAAGAATAAENPVREWRVAHEGFWNGYLDEIRNRLGDPDWALTDATRIVCQRFRLVERFPEALPPEEPA